MAYTYVCVVDAEEGHDITGQNVRFAQNDKQIEQQLHHLSLLHPTATLCVYKLHNLRKLKSKPVYAQYKVTPDGEIVPA